MLPMPEERYTDRDFSGKERIFKPLLSAYNRNRQNL